MRIKISYRRKRVIVAAALSLLSIFHAHAASPEKIVNAGFEQKFTGWADEDPSAISDVAYKGARSGKITGDGGYLTQVVEVKANTNYELSAYIKGSGKIGVEMDGTFYSNTGGGKDFEKVIVSFNSREATYIIVFANYYQGEGRFDNFKLKNKDDAWFF